MKFDSMVDRCVLNISARFFGLKKAFIYTIMNVDDDNHRARLYGLQKAKKRFFDPYGNLQLHRTHDTMHFR